jgi:hypothetical protein
MKKHDTYDKGLADSFLLPNGRMLWRGTLQWDLRELERYRRGCCCISLGSLVGQKLLKELRQDV